jgi:hypothetical protein
VLEQPTATWEELDELVAFCPCGLRSNADEHELLLDLFLARTAPFQGDGGTTRRASLGLMLDLASQAARDPDYAFEGLLRGGAYTGALVDGSTWQVPKPLERVLRGWGTYQRNELLSLAVQGLFAAVLRAIERDEGQEAFGKPATPPISRCDCLRPVAPTRSSRSTRSSRACAANCRRSPTGSTKTTSFNAAGVFRTCP